MFLERIELKSLDQLRYDGCEVDVRKGEEGHPDLLLIKTKDHECRSVTFAISGDGGQPWPVYVRSDDKGFIMKKETYAAFRHLFKDEGEDNVHVN